MYGMLLITTVIVPNYVVLMHVWCSHNIWISQYQIYASLYYYDTDIPLTPLLYSIVCTKYQKINPHLTRNKDSFHTLIRISQYQFYAQNISSPRKKTNIRCIIFTLLPFFFDHQWYHSLDRHPPLRLSASPPLCSLTTVSCPAGN